MDIKNLVKKHLSEAKMSKETESFLLNKWNGVPIETIKKIFDWFESVKNSFPSDINQVTGRILSFLGWFNGSSPNRPKFELKNLRDIRSYSVPQIKRLWNEYKSEPLFFGGEEKPLLSVDEIFYKKVDNAVPKSDEVRKYIDNEEGEDVSPEVKELFTKSKGLWFGTNHLLYEDNGFRVYGVPDQATSIAFGWYLKYMRDKYNMSNGGQWCTTTPSANNFFQSKRQDRSFYFVIDESKFPTSNNNYFSNSDDAARHMPNFYLAALQKTNTGDFKMSGIHNPGEPYFNETKLLEIYPKLGALLNTDKLKYVPWSKNDQLNKGRDVDPVSMINEVEGNEYEFAVRPPNEKLEYINRDGAVLRKAKSWNSMTDAMKKQYSFATLTVNNWTDKFSNSELFKVLNNGERTTLHKKMLILFPNNGGIKMVINNIMQNDFYVDERLSLNKDYLSLYKSRSSGKFGIYNLTEDNWVNHEGVTYDDEYQQISERAYKTKDGKRFFVVIYSRTSQPDNSSFYVLLPTVGNKIDGYFASAKKWDELKIQLVGETDPEKTNTEFNPEMDNDIKENKQTEKFITCDGCNKKFTQTIYKGKKSKPVCPHCGKLNKKEE